MPDRPPGGQRFRDTCTGCSAAKVRCSKTRPRCTRCDERGLQCNYALSHRFGRLPAGGRRPITHSPWRGAGVLDFSQHSEAAGSARPDTTSPTPTPTPRERPLPLPSGRARPALGDSLDSDLCLDFSLAPQSHDTALAPSAPRLGPQETISLSHDPDSFDGILPDGDTGPPRPADLNAGFAGVLAGSLQQQENASATSLSIPNLLRWFEDPVGAPTGALGDLRQWSSCSAQSSPQHSCLRQATEILVTLKESEASSGDMDDYFVVLPSDSHMPVRAIKMLSCTCAATDDSLVLVVVMAAFEVLERYHSIIKSGATVAASGEHSYEEARACTQAVLGQLHGFYPLTELLARRASAELAGPDAGFLPIPGTGSGGRILSASVFQHLELDLRRRLQGATNEAVTFLRRVDSYV
ncbi:hypothetical protein GQ53DRAFT_746205 [Thozetella sp. PMI_491]|nr:hypothetical protein GQ53DRAFT_746205 [Thozetella sp. PMI_491]